MSGETLLTYLCVSSSDICEHALFCLFFFLKWKYGGIIDFGIFRILGILVFAASSSLNIQT
jgi:hypothetical protein